VGPTASGKTAIALELAKRLNVEIVSCDSMQVYKEMNIATDKPPKSVRDRLPHHLVDIVSVTRNYNVADYRKQAICAIKQIHRKNKIPLIVGGSGLYAKVLLDGIFSGGKADREIRNKLYRQAKIYGKGYLFRRLERVDPLASKRIHPNDLRRIVRALEVFKKTKIPISRLQNKTRGLFQDYDVNFFGLQLNRKKLYQKIDERVDKMFRRGVIKEVKGVLNKRLSKTAKRIIGITEVKGFLEHRYSKEDAMRLLKRNTRRYAKKQLTWFRKEKRIKWIKLEGDEEPQVIAKRIISLLNF
jgi:tRNA dimethylallyltransferase